MLRLIEAAATQLTAARTEAAKRLEKLAVSQINDLAMNVKFHVHVTAEKDRAQWTAQGWDQVECLIATNAGEPLKPLDEIASGGEMSRVMLALKVTVEEGASGVTGRKKKTVLPRTLVFDEIDIGIGGRAAEAVGRKLKTLSKGQQVLCITHLPQIAAFGDQHSRDREDREARADADDDPVDGGRGANAGDCPDVEWREAYGDEPEACGAVDREQPVSGISSVG